MQVKKTASTPSSWSDTNGNSNGSKGPGDYYIISNRAFITAAGTLKAVRDKEGTDTRIVDVDDLLQHFRQYRRHQPLRRQADRMVL